MNSDINNLPTLPEFIVMTIITIIIVVVAYKLMKKEDDTTKARQTGKDEI